MYIYIIYANIWGILMGSMLPYIAAPWILWDAISSGATNITTTEDIFSPILQGEGIASRKIYLRIQIGWWSHGLL